jgi:hypothetical protein
VVVEEEGAVAEEVVVEVDVALQVAEAVDEEDLVEAVREGVVEEVPWAEGVVEALALAGAEEDFRITLIVIRTGVDSITSYNMDM